MMADFIFITAENTETIEMKGGWQVVFLVLYLVYSLFSILHIYNQTIVGISAISKFYTTKTSRLASPRVFDRQR